MSSVCLPPCLLPELRLLDHSRPISSFTLSPHLPIELRLLIWEISLPIPCTKLDGPGSGPWTPYHQCSGLHYRFPKYVDSLIYPLLLTTRESREVAITKHFTEETQIANYFSLNGRGEGTLRLSWEELEFLRSKYGVSFKEWIYPQHEIVRGWNCKDGLGEIEIVSRDIAGMFRYR